MTNKCSNCGFEYGEFDIYCSRCGHKIDENADLRLTAREVYDRYAENSENDGLPLMRNVEFFNKRKEYESNIFDAFAVMFVISLILTVCVFFLSNKQNNMKAYLHYKSLITKPSQIPILKNTDSLEEFGSMLKKNEYFLKLYLKYSNDNNEKKEQIFSDYLKEITKLDTITNEILPSSKHPECGKINDTKTLKSCTLYYKKELKNSGAAACGYKNKIYLFPDKKFISKSYSKFVSSEMKNFLKLESKYSKPAALDGILYEKPSKLSEKISKYEKFYNNSTNHKTKMLVEPALFNDARNIIFARDIYTTTTQEMQTPYKKALNGFINKNKYSALNSLFLSYLDKQREYTQDNFKKDYPYKIFENSFNENVENTTFKDIFAGLRKNMAAKGSNNINFAYVYNLMDGRWTKYKNNYELNSHNYIMSYPDEDNNVTFYNFAYTPVQELNIQDSSELFINSGYIYIYNHDKLSVSKITYNGKTFNTKNLNFTDVTSLFPGIDIINIDSANGYDIYVEKANKKASFIVLSRYSQGLKDYEFRCVRGEISRLALSNMFSVDTSDEVVVSFQSKLLDEGETSEQYPTYKIHISTIGQPKIHHEAPKNDFIQSNEPVDNESENEFEPYTPTIKPKIDKGADEALILPPAKTLEPPADDE